MNRAVPDFGPYDAPLLVIGEAGGKDEGRLGRPFVGATGRRVREFVADAGLHPENQVRYANVIPIEMATLPKTPAGMQAVVRAHWASIDATLLRGSHRAVVIYGRAALWRLTGATKVSDHQGAVTMIEVGGRMVPCVASVHPAAIMRSKIEAGWTLVRAATERACRYATGTLVYDPERMMPRQRWGYTGADVEAVHEAALATGRPVAIDCEYDRVTKRPFMIGISCDGEEMTSVVPLDDTIAALRRMCDDDQVTKVMHHCPADVTALMTLGITVRPPIHDTLMMYATLFPDLPVGLGRVALHLLDHMREWKGMAHDDPAYNAIDVATTWRSFVALVQRMNDTDMWRVYLREVRHVGILAMAMEARGLAVDAAAQRAAVAANEAKCGRLRAEVNAHVADLFACRLAGPTERLATVTAALAGITQPRLKKDRDPVVDGHVAALRKERTKCETAIKRWSRGFDLGNNEHLRWLLYDADGFKLPVQKVDGRPTANADAIARLLALKKVQSTPMIATVLVDIKEYQHARKMTNTFLLWDKERDAPSAAIDGQGFAHPEYRPFGAGSGRMAGGPDSDLGDKQVNQYSYNALNIPEETRAIYVPHPSSFTVAPVAGAEEIDDAGFDEE